MADFPGGRTPTETLSWHGSAGATYSPFTTPTGRAMLNGDKRVLVTTVAAYTSGRGGARACRFFIAGAYGPWFTLPASSYAEERYQSFPVLIPSGVGATYGWEVDGAAYLGHRAAPGSSYTTPAGTESGRALSGGFDYSTAPTAARSVAASPLSPTAVKVTWSSPSNDGGSGITGYRVQRATNSAFTAGVSSADVGSGVREYSFTGLATGTTYYFRVLARNAVTNAAGTFAVASNTAQASPLLGSPIVDSFGSGSVLSTLRAEWSPPSPSTGLTGYQVQIATNAAFTSGVRQLTTTDEFAEFPDCVAGIWHYVRVRASTSSGFGSWSAVSQYAIPAETGNIDGWRHVGTVPPGAVGMVPELVRRTVVDGRQSLVMESFISSSATFGEPWGIERTIRGLEAGRVYRWSLSARLLGAAAGVTYRLGADLYESLPLTVSESGWVYAEMEWISTAAEVPVGFYLDGPLTASGTIDFVAIAGMTVEELSSDTAYRLQSTVYESSLANHLDLACNSVGAGWYVARDGVTRFRLPREVRPLRAVFTDRRAAGKLEYIDIAVGVDTKSLVNRITGANRGIDGEGHDDSPEFVATNAASASRFGDREASVDLNLYEGGIYDGSVPARLAELLAGHAEPTLLISAITWNAQEDEGVAALLEIGDRVSVEFNGWLQDSRVLSLKHTITGKRWLIEIGLVPLRIVPPSVEVEG